MYYSPLRYPGGKSKLAPFMEIIIDKLDIKGGTYVEPFAGGAGIALELLQKNIVERIVINDYDKAIAAFWKAVVNENERFIQKMYETPVTIDEWYRQRIIVQNTKKYSFELGFATFFLNRTNRSGIINGGPIGGYDQNGKWKLDVRFNKQKLEKRIRAIGERKEDIYVYNKDAKSLIVNYLPRYGERTLVYFDPPYFEKGKELYMNYFTLKDHKEIERVIRENIQCKWIITYDDTEEITNIYDRYIIRRFDLIYSAAEKRTASELMIFPDDEMCPTTEELEKKGICINFR